jgi:hypothetical protein
MSLLEMTPKGALERIVKIPVRPAPDNSLDLVAMITAKKALQKQITKKPKRENGNWNCPICGYPAIRISYQPKKYCDECGQALDWSS